MDASEWDERYREMPSLWGARPNRWVEQEVAALAPGRALDLACGEGRNALWLAQRGWTVQAVDFSPVALAKAEDAQRHLARSAPVEAPPGAPTPVEWLLADATTFATDLRFDLALLCYLQLRAPQRRAAVRAAARVLAPGGTLLVIGHHRRNLSDGVGGPQDATYLFTPEDVRADLDGIDGIDGIHLTIETATEVLRPVPGAPRPAVDALIRAVRT